MGTHARGVLQRVGDVARVDIKRLGTHARGVLQRVGGVAHERLGTHARGVLQRVGDVARDVSARLRLREGDVLGGPERLPIDRIDGAVTKARMRLD